MASMSTTPPTTTSADAQRLDNTLKDFQSWSRLASKPDHDQDAFRLAIDLRHFLTYKVEQSAHKDEKGDTVCMNWTDLRELYKDLGEVIIQKLGLTRPDAFFNILPTELLGHCYDLINHYPVVCEREAITIDRSDESDDSLNKVVNKLLTVKLRGDHNRESDDNEDLEEFKKRAAEWNERAGNKRGRDERSGGERVGGDQAGIAGEGSQPKGHLKEKLEELYTETPARTEAEFRALLDKILQAGQSRTDSSDTNPEDQK